MSLTSTEKQILAGIPVGSENNPDRPEFPPEDPKFPATPTYQIQVPGFSNVWLKDESYNPTGTHKDRMAWEIVVTYRNFLLAKEGGQMNRPLPHMSIISSGSAAVAIQSMLRRFKLPNLKVLVDAHLDGGIITQLENLGCDVYKTDLSKRAYTWRDILALTNNQNGFDITSGTGLDPQTRFYDWLSYEIMNTSPDYCFVPFGTGTLYENILNRVRSEASSEISDPRFQGDLFKACSCNYFGATTSDPHSKAVKLYSSHLPFVQFDEQWISFYRLAGYCGPLSDVRQIQESYLEKAFSLANEQKIQCEPSGLAGLALMLQMENDLPRDAKILIVNTGKVKR